MNLDKCLHEKRGCKDYNSKQIPLELIGEVLDAGTCAPSAGNLQNWIFIVVTEASKKEAIASACLDQTWMKNAPVHIVICNNVAKVTDMYPTRGKLYATQACAIAAQDIMLKATDLGLHSCWVGAFNEGAVRSVLNIPDEVIPEMIITLGYCDTVHEPIERDSCDKVTYFNDYGNKEITKSVFPLQKQGQQIGSTIQRAMDSRKGEPSRGIFDNIKQLFKKKS